MFKKFPFRYLLIFLVLLSVAWISSALIHAASGHKPYDFSLVRHAYQSITASEAQIHVNLLASDNLEGRETGKAGQWLAAKYIANAYLNYGLKAVGEKHRFYQNFQIELRDLQQATLTLKQRRTTARDEIHFFIKEDFVPFDFTGENNVMAGVVFAGFGITAPELHYDDYEDIDVTGKVVLVFRHEPQEHNPKSIFRGTKLTKHAYFEEKVKNAIAHGAIGLLLVTDPAGKHDSAFPPFSWPSIKSRRSGSERWKLQIHEKLSAFPSAWISPECAATILAPSHRSLRDVQKNIDATLRPESFVIEDTRVCLTIKLKKEIRRTQNVVGLIEGSHPGLKNEVVVVGAHYDHIGIINGKIHNGADDNASGTAGLLEIAEAFTELPTRPKRSVLFIAFSAEELGLLGSEFYVKNPIFALKNTVAMINMDMIGRNTANEVSVIGSNRSPEIHEINERANQEIGLELKYNGEHFFSRSDQANFAKHHIPVIFYNTGVHRDYHAAGDLSQKIDAQKLSRIASLAFLVVWQIAQDNEKPTYRPFKIHRF
ncbi:MAG: M20/M25/M40 family metallo-hydrolase [bacterium]